MSGLLRITMPHFVAGAVEVNGRIMHAAPVLGWSVGRKTRVLERWVIARGGRLERLGDEGNAGTGN